jgi:hypothetical protein
VSGIAFGVVPNLINLRNLCEDGIKSAMTAGIRSIKQVASRFDVANASQ